MTLSATTTAETLGEKMKPDGGPTPAPSVQSLERLAFKPSSRLRNAKVKHAELILFTTELSVMLDSGVVLSDALDAIVEQAENETFKMVIMEVSEAVKGGETFSRALTAYRKVFNAMFISMVEASEASGKMAEMLQVLSGYLNFESETRKRIKGALTYPFIIALMAVACFAEVYENLRGPRRRITEAYANISWL